MPAWRVVAGIKEAQDAGVLETLGVRGVVQHRSIKDVPAASKNFHLLANICKAAAPPGLERQFFAVNYLDGSLLGWVSTPRRWRCSWLGLPRMAWCRGVRCA